jgi:cGMP-dependent protein kinase
LKPENLIVDLDGYLKLLDFGTAKIVTSRTYSVIGTPHYMAPEVILGKGYMFSADVWSFGVMVYEMLCGTVPFGDDSDSDPFNIYKMVILGKVKYPDFINSVSKAFIQDLLHQKISKRSKVEVFRSHEFFAGNDWEAYLSRKKNPPYKPCCENYDRLVEVSIDQDQVVEKVLNRTKDNSGFDECKNTSHFVSIDWDREF